MRGPRDPSAARGRRPRGRRAPPPGGKALARLRQFQQERALARPDPRRKAQASARPGKTIGRAPAAGYLEAFEARRSLAAATPVAAGWRPLGPYSIPHGQTYGAGPGSRPSVAGRISAVAVDPSDADHILVGAGGGGIWESRRRGRSWTARTDDQPSLAIGAIAFTPGDPSIVYAGTGEGDAFWQLGTGLLRSTDGGSTWSVHHTGPFVGQGFFDIVVDPLNPNHLLAATTAGLFRSTDGGTTWSRRRQGWVYRLSMHPAVPGDPQSTREVLAGCADGAWRSTNGGQSWSQLSLPEDPGGFQRLEVCHAPSNGNVAYIFGADEGDFPSAYLWRRSTRGGGFARSHQLPGDLQAGQAWYDWHAAVAPHNPDVLYLGAIELHRGVRSPQRRWTWETISARGSGDSIHPDQHAMAFSPTSPNVIYAANDGGLYRSSNAGRTWESLNKGLAITEFEYITDHPRFDAWLMGGTQDNGTLRYEGGPVWFHVQDGDGGDCGTNHSKPYTCFHSFYGMGLEKSNQGGRAETWSWTGPDATGYSLFYPPMEVRDDLVVQAGSEVYFSRNNGSSWRKTALPSTAGNATAIAIRSSTSVYVGTESGRTYRFDRSGANWQRTAIGRPRDGYISDLLVDPTNPSRIWATSSTFAGGHVFRSDDAGATWSDVSAGLPTIPVNAVELDPADPDTVWVGADVGVYRSTDAGATWAPYGNLLPNALVRDLLFHDQTRLLRAATQSRGVWEIAVDHATMPDVEVYLRDSAVDTGRRTPSPDDVADPFLRGSRTHWWESTDIKVDSPPYQVADPDDVDFELFEDDHGMAASGLADESPRRGRTARVYVQVHNRGPKTAIDVAVRVFAAGGGLALPDLPGGFWTGFPSNTLPSGSPWKAIAPHKVIPRVGPGRSQVVAFEWAVPASGSAQPSLLAAISAANDPIATTELNVAALVRGERRCALKSVTLVNPSPQSAPRVRAVKLDLWPAAAPGGYALGFDRDGGAMVRGVLLPKRLAASARDDGLEPVELDDEDRAALAELAAEDGALERRLDTGTAYRPRRGGALLDAVDLAGDGPEPIVVLVGDGPRPGRWALVQRAADGEPVGGFTLRAGAAG